MVINNRAVLTKAMKKYADSRKAIQSWVASVEGINPQNFIELRLVFGSANIVGENEILICFDIKGNHYRLTAKVIYPNMIFLKEFLTHAEYSKKYKYKGKKNE
jgi:mRNA-degrading endonuclease HigB of HigAB toxin-antitoxin module